MEEWESECPIPACDLLYVRVHEGFINKPGKLRIPNAGAFYNAPKYRDGGKDLSSDWNKFCSPMDTKQRAGREYKTGTAIFKDPSKYYVVSFLIKSVLSLEDASGKPLNVKVEHSPMQEHFPNELAGYPWNRAHTSIIGDDEERRIKMIEIAKWEIPPSDYNSKDDTRTFAY